MAVLLRAIDRFLPRRAILYLEGVVDRRLKAFLRAHAAANPMNVKRGTIWPRRETFHLEIEGENLEELARLAEVLPVPEVCDHLIVYRNGKVLLAAHALAASQEIWLSRELPSESMSNLVNALMPKPEKGAD